MSLAWKVPTTAPVPSFLTATLAGKAYSVNGQTSSGATRVKTPSGKSDTT